MDNPILKELFNSFNPRKIKLDKIYDIPASSLIIA